MFVDSDKLKFSFGWNGSRPNEVAIKIIEEHYIFNTTIWRYQYRDGLTRVYLPCDGFSISIDIVGALGCFYELFNHIVYNIVVIRSGSRQ